MQFRALLLALAVTFSANAWAGALRVSVVTPDGAPIADAVVTLTGTRVPPGPIHFSWPMRVAQRNLQFDPFVLIVPAGAEVAFPNLDNVRHHVYSFSPAGPFELRLYGRDESRSVRFSNPGVIAVGCNIHDQMSAFIYVVDTPYAAKTDAHGVAVIEDAPAGSATLRLWHPYLRAPANTLERTVQISANGGAERFEASLRRPPVRHSAY
jgi:plastocyanin